MLWIFAERFFMAALRQCEKSEGCFAVFTAQPWTAAVLFKLQFSDGTLEGANLGPGSGRIEPDPDDPDQQTLLLWYPTVTAEGADYIRRAVKVESGAKSALDPHSPVKVKPYVADELKDVPFDIANVTTVEPGSTFWDKVVILHGLRRWWEQRGELRGGGQRVSRHYYDVYSMLAPPQGDGFAADRPMAADC